MKPISTGLFYDRSTAAMGSLSARADKLQTQIATGKRLQAASDDSAGYQRLRGLARETADDTVYGGNLKIAGAVLQQGDTTLTAISDQLGRASELAIQARNGTLGDTDRTAIATELAGIAQTLSSLAGAADARGQPLFGGSDGAAAITTGADGRRTFNASTPATIPIGRGQGVQPSENATRIFVLDPATGRNSIDLVADLAATLRAGGDVDAAAKGAITDLATAGIQVADVQASLGTRALRVDVETARLADTAIDREAARSDIEDADFASTYADLQKTMTVLSATQASFSKLSNLSLFDYLR